MSLSSGTLNLKFMQRAAARSGAPAAVAEPTGPVVEDANKWVLPRRGNAEAGPSKPRVQFVASYMPFLEAGEAEGADGGDGGRRSFGGFGRKEAEEEKEEDGDGDEMDYDSEEDERKRRVRDKKSKKEKEEEEIVEPRTFKRPSGFDSPRSNGSAGKSKEAKPKSQADKLRATISGLKSVSMSPSSSRDGGSGSASPLSTSSKGDKKRPHPSAGDTTPKRAKVEQPKGKQGKPGKSTALDEREKAMKAAKKAEKKAKKKSA